MSAPVDEAGGVWAGWGGGSGAATGPGGGEGAGAGAAAAPGAGEATGLGDGLVSFPSLADVVFWAVMGFRPPAACIR
jgi:hypothetical protein